MAGCFLAETNQTGNGFNLPHFTRQGIVGSVCPLIKVRPKEKAGGPAQTARYFVFYLVELGFCPMTNQFAQLVPIFKEAGKWQKIYKQKGKVPGNG